MSGGTGITSETEFQWGRRGIQDAMRWVGAGNAMPRIAIALSAAIVHAIRGWLLARGIDPGPSDVDAAERFRRFAGRELLRLRNEYSGKWGLLEYRLIGDPDDIVDAVPPERWLLLARDAAADAQALVQAIEADVSGTTKPG